MNPKALLLAAAIATAACQSATIRSSTRDGYDATKLRSWFWLSPDRAGLSGLSEEERTFSRWASEVVGEELARRGYVENAEDPDFLVMVAGSARRGTRKGNANWNYHGGAGWGGDRYAKTRIKGSDFSYEEGMIIVWAFDARTGEDFWDVWARDAIKESDPYAEEGVAKVIRAMMSRFPASAPAAR